MEFEPDSLEHLQTQFAQALERETSVNIADWIPTAWTPDQKRELLGKLLAIEHTQRPQNQSHQSLLHLLDQLGWGADVIAHHAASHEMLPEATPDEVSNDSTGLYATEHENLFAAGTRISVRGDAIEQSGETLQTDSSPWQKHVQRLMPGQVVADRYRIVALLGKGGMGEVYRADDLRLGQSVALKFLNDRLHASEELLRFFYDEVRLSQRLNHPHICRVHDLVESGKHRFISMEFVEGETLQVLLRRIGALPETKALELSQQICAGLAAAHAAGVVHRDLKPANIMIDERGCARIADFGLAYEPEVGSQVQGLVGTPTYMAPEQLARGETSVRSDIFALGLILYELFTGRRATQGKTLEQISSLLESNAPWNQVQEAEELAAPVASAIAACLAKAPADRPENVFAVAELLPGHRPTGSFNDVTPSPDMLAANTQLKGPYTRARMFSLAAIATGFVCLAMLLSSIAFKRFHLRESPEVLKSKARDVVQAFVGSNASFVAAGFAPNKAALKFEASTPTGEPGRIQASDQARQSPTSPANVPGAYFWYREHPHPIAPRIPDWTGESFLAIDELRPPVTAPGSVQLQLDGMGRLMFFRSLPSLPQPSDSRMDPGSPSSPGTAQEPANIADQHPDAAIQTVLFEALGISAQDRLLYRAVPNEDLQFTPPDFADDLRSWVLDEASSSPLNRPPAQRFDVAFRGGKICYVNVRFPWPKVVEQIIPAGAASSIPALALARILWLPILFFTAVWLARKNLFARRADRAGALRLAAFCGGLFTLKWVLCGHHVNSSLELDLLMSTLAGACLLSCAVWCAYLAFEPYVRRHWPDMLIGWSRLLQGRIRDSIVQREVLFGIAAGGLAAIGKLFVVLAPTWLGYKSYGLSNIYTLTPLMGLRGCLEEILEAANMATIYALFFQLLFLLALNWLLRSRLAASVLFVVFMAALVALQFQPASLSFGITVLEMCLTLFLFFRIGLLSVVFMHFTRLLLKFPVSMDTSHWSAESGQVAGFVLLALILYTVLETWQSTPKPLANTTAQS